MKASLIITTYNWPAALALVLASVKTQTYPEFDLVIADDGSGSETAVTIQEHLSQAPFAWRHVRHNDAGIRQARIKNLAVLHAHGDHFIFIDHDVVLHPEFISDHIAHALGHQNCFLQGKRVFISEKMTQKCLNDIHFPRPSLFQPGIENRKNGLHVPFLAKLMALPKKFQVTLRGCNLSMSRKNFLTVDGYDEIFDGLWGREDSDICYRMFHSGIKIKNLWFAALQYHLYHPSIKRLHRDRLDEELDKRVAEKCHYAVCGFSRLSSEGEVVAGNY